MPRPITGDQAMATEESGNIPLTRRASVARTAIRFVTSRASGPGGQHVNKVSSRVQMFVPLRAILGLDEPAHDRLRKIAGRKMTGEDELLIVSETSRSQQSNKDECIKRLAAMVAQAEVVPKKRRPTKPTKGSVERRLQSKQQQGARKRDRRSARDGRED